MQIVASSAEAASRPETETLHTPVAVPSIEVRVARSFAEVEAIRDIWSAWPSHRDSEIDFCLEFGWRRSEVVRPHVIVLLRDGRADAMLVGWIEDVRLRSKIGYVRMPGIKARLLNFSYAGFLGNTSPENSLEFIRSITGALRRGEAHMANLDHLPVDGPLREAAERSSGFATRDRLIKPEPHCLMTLASTIDGVYHGFSQGLRAEVRRKKRKIEADFAGKLAIRRYRHEQDLDGVIPNLEQIAKTTYQRGIGVGFHDTAEMQQRLRLCARKGWLRIYVVTIENRPCAFWVGTVTNRTFLSDYNGYDPSLRNYSLGTYLLANMIEEFCNEGVKAIDFGFGQAEYKDRFSNVRRIEASISLFAPTAMGLALNAMRTSTGAIDSAARKILNRTNLLPRIKKLWRQHASHSSSPASN